MSSLFNLLGTSVKSFVNMSNRALGLGTGISISRSNLPQRLDDESTDSILLVIAIIKILLSGRLPMSSRLVKMLDDTRFSVSLSREDLKGHRMSISSRIITDGERSSASRNRFLIVSSGDVEYLLYSSAGLIKTMFERDSFARAWVIKFFPVPDEPYSSTDLWNGFV